MHDEIQDDQDQGNFVHNTSINELQKNTESPIISEIEQRATQDVTMRENGESKDHTEYKTGANGTYIDDFSYANGLSQNISTNHKAKPEQNAKQNEQILMNNSGIIDIKDFA